MLKAVVIGLAHPHVFAMMEELSARDVRIVALCDPESPENLQKAIVSVPGAAVYNTVEEALACDADFVISSSEFCKNGELAAMALAAGKHIAVDKPLAVNDQTMRRVEKAVADNPDCKLFLWLTLRYDPALCTAKRLIAEGAIGAAVNISIFRPYRLGARPDWFYDKERYGGLFTDIGVHDLDMIGWLCASRVSSVLGARASTARHDGIDDNATAMVLTESGCVGTIYESWLTPDKFPAHGDVRVSIHGTRGQIHISYWPEVKLTMVSDEREYGEVPLDTQDIAIEDDFLMSLKDPSHVTRVPVCDAIESTKLALEVKRKAQ